MTSTTLSFTRWGGANVGSSRLGTTLRSDGSSSFVNNPTSAMSQQELGDRVRALTS